MKMLNCEVHKYQHLQLDIHLQWQHVEESLLS
jgi:hypothetical protein